MNPEFRAALHKDFLTFLCKAFKVLHPMQDLRVYSYIELLCAYLERLERGENLRAIVNIGPRSLKTFVCSQAFVAWVLGRHPEKKIMVITCSEGLAKEIAYSARRIMRSSFYKDNFTTRIAKDRSSLLDFATTRGGGCFTSPIGAAITGRGADIIIVDDPHDIKDAANDEKLAGVFDQFNREIVTRLNNPKTGRILIVAHRISEADLSGHLLKHGDYTSLSFPLIAPRAMDYSIGQASWCRKQGEFLQPGLHTEKQIEHLKCNLHNPDFETLYQQNPNGELAFTIQAKHFRSFDPPEIAGLPVVLSVDPGLVAGKKSSNSVVQAWCRRGNTHFLIDQWKGQVEFDELFPVCRRFRRSYRAVNIIIERSALGPAVIAEAKRRGWQGIFAIVPDGRSKPARFRPHAETIGKGAIRLPRDADWRGEFIEELVRFPHGSRADQVDACTQYLDWGKDRPELPPLEPRAIGRVSFGSDRRRR